MESVRLSESENKSDETKNSSAFIRVEVAYAKPEKQIILELQVSKDSKPRDVVRLSQINQEFPEIDLDNVKMGVFGKLISENYALQDRDRIELYRPLLADPKEVRRRLAAEGKTMGKKKNTD